MRLMIINFDQAAYNNNWQECVFIQIVRNTLSLKEDLFSLPQYIYLSEHVNFGSKVLVKSYSGFINNEVQLAYYYTEI